VKHSYNTDKCFGDLNICHKSSFPSLNKCFELEVLAFKIFGQHIDNPIKVNKYGKGLNWFNLFIYVYIFGIMLVQFWLKCYIDFCIVFAR